MPKPTALLRISVLHTSIATTWMLRKTPVNVLGALLNQVVMTPSGRNNKETISSLHEAWKEKPESRLDVKGSINSY